MSREIEQKSETVSTVSVYKGQVTSDVNSFFETRMMRLVYRFLRLDYHDHSAD